MHCTYLLLQFRDFVCISGSQILGYLGWVVQGQMQGCKGIRQSRGEAQGESQVESTRQGRVDIQIVGTYMTQGTFIVWAERITCIGSEGTKKVVWVEHGTWRGHDTGVTIELGMEKT